MSTNTYPLLSSVNDPADLRRLSRAELKALSTELRAFVLDSVSKTGALLQGSVMMGATCGHADAAALAGLAAYGAAAGPAFPLAR